MEHFFTEAIPDPKPNETGALLKQFFWELFQTLLMATVLFLAINAVSSRIRVKSISMQPTLYEKDFVIVNKLAYQLGEPNRGDIVIFHHPFNADTEPYIKRVIGLPGETVRIENGQVFVNEIPLQEPYINAPPNYKGTWTIPQETLFVLGDNRNNSSDSHQWGTVPLENVIGKAVLVYFPISHWQYLDPATAAAAGP